MQETMPHNQILPFFAPSNKQNAEFQYLQFTSEDNYEVFVAGALTSQNITNHYDYLEIGLNEVKVQFNIKDGPIFDRMKDVIYASGDSLANELIASNQPVDDVDFNVGIFAFKEGVIYVWIDGDLNARIYRREESLLVNEERNTQFFGSMGVELGDIIAISHTEYLEERDELAEDYVVGRKDALYPSLYIDYQIEHVESYEANKVIHNENQGDFDTDEEVDLTSYQVIDHEISEQHEVASPIYETEIKEDQSTYTPLHEDAEEAEEHEEDNERRFKPSDRFNELKNSSVFASIAPAVKNSFNKIHDFFLKITSVVIDFFYTKVLQKNTHESKRFESSSKKRLLQYLLIFVIFATGAYLLFFRSGSAKNSETVTGDQQTNTANTKTPTPDVRGQIQSKFNEVQQYYNASQFPQFSQAQTELNTLVSTAKTSGFNDAAFLTTIASQVLQLEDTLYKNTAVTKVDEIYLASNIANVNIVDFDTVGNDVYAIDQANAQVLKSSANQQFEVFAGAANLKNMIRISCASKDCYVLDSENGLAVLNLANKTFSPFTGLKDAGKGVTEMEYYASGSTGNIYTLTPAEGKVTRYRGNGSGGFQAGTKWNQSPGFGADSVDFTVDSNIFEITNAGALKKYFGGNFDGSFGGLESALPQLGTNVEIAMTPARETGKNRLYIADSSNKRIAVYNKDLNPNKKYTYLGSYKYRGSDQVKFENFSQLRLSSDEKSLYLLEGNSVYKLTVTAL